jgi:hypothetical protein
MCRVGSKDCKFHAVTVADTLGSRLSKLFWSPHDAQGDGGMTVRELWTLSCENGEHPWPVQQRDSGRRVVSKIDSERETDNLSSAIRLFVFKHYRHAAHASADRPSKSERYAPRWEGQSPSRARRVSSLPPFSGSKRAGCSTPPARKGVPSRRSGWLL